ncbi:hypothetical protein, partial [Salmonella enterica]|uniref:hypothetical protein n=1 Tax=Salmonella enterica TaxID=28901 RepID=UPI003F4BF95C
PPPPTHNHPPPPPHPPTHPPTPPTPHPIQHTPTKYPQQHSLPGPPKKTCFCRYLRICENRLRVGEL